MKNAIILFCSIFSITLSAQDVMEADKVMSKGLQNAASIEIMDSEDKAVEIWWKEYMRSYTKKMKKDRKSKEWFADDVEIEIISSGTPVDLFAKIESAGKNSVVSAWVEAGDSFISSTANPSGYSGMEELLMGLDHYVQVEKINDELSEAEKVLKKMEGDLKKLENQNEGYHKEIENAKDKIAKAEENIIKNEELQEAKQENIQDQMRVVEEVRIKLDEKKNERNN